ncbi:MAG: GNAT family N-acetyltransferase [Burkholderiales bacterium]
MRQADWNRDRTALRAVRKAVFIAEQGVPEALEWDEADADCQHALAEAGGSPIGTGRLLPDGHIGRLAVVAAWRGHGVGTALLELMLAMARRHGHRHIELNAQTQALAFYARFGFRPQGADFDDAGIAHRRMTLDLD